jgi:TolA-binding protein
MHPDLKRLRELPDAEAPPYGYGEFSRRYTRRRGRQARAPLRLMAVALAVVVAGWVMKHGLLPAMTEVAAVDPPPPAFAQGAPMAVSGNAERWLNAQPRSAIVRVPTQMAVTELEDQIASMDDQLNAMRLAQPHAQQLAVLQQDRAQLVESLAQVRYAQILVAGMQ